MLISIDSLESSKNELDNIFNLIYPAIIKFLNYKKVNNPDVFSDFIFQIYQDFYDFLIKAKKFYSFFENFVFYYFFIKFLYFEWQNFNRKRKTSFNKEKNENFEYIDKINNESFSISSNIDNQDLLEIKQIIKKCLEKHFEIEERIMFLTYYYFLLDNEDFISISKFLNIPLLKIIDTIDNYVNSIDNQKFIETLDEKAVKFFFDKDINSFRVAISRIKKKMKIKCNYLAENYLFSDKGII